VKHFEQLAKDHAASPFAAEALFHVAEDQYDKKAFAEAAKAYETALTKQPAGELSEKIQYKLGWASYQQKDYVAAHKAFSAQLKDHAQGALAADAGFMQAECLYKQDMFKEALSAFQAVVKTKLTSPTMETLALLHGGQSAAQLKQWKESLDLVSQIPVKFPDSVNLAEAHYALGWAKQNLMQTDEALKDYEVAATKSTDVVGARARFMMGEIQFEKKAYDAAIREFQRAMFGVYGTSTETKNWQAKSGFEAGRCAHVQVKDAKDPAEKAKLVADARRFFTFVVEKHPEHELAAEAKKILGDLSKL
jgi:TolA-binding protein